MKAYLHVRPKVDGDLLFLSRTHSTLDPCDVQRMVFEAARREGLKFGVTPHTLGHSFATRFLTKNQGDLATLATILGHANISTTTAVSTPQCPPDSGDGGRDVVAHRPAELGTRIKMGVLCDTTRPDQSYRS